MQTTVLPLPLLRLLLRVQLLVQLLLPPITTAHIFLVILQSMDRLQLLLPAEQVHCNTVSTSMAPTRPAMCLTDLEQGLIPSSSKTLTIVSLQKWLLL